MNDRNSEHLTQERLRELLIYDATSGCFFWLASRRERVKVGDVAGSVTSHGYLRIRVAGRQYPAHRLAWLYVYGEWPKHHIDHIDGNRKNNAIDNLRDVSYSGNSQNKKVAHANNKCGLLGVCARGSRWLARITISGKLTQLGAYDTPELAHAAYLRAKRLHHETCTI